MLISTLKQAGVLEKIIFHDVGLVLIAPTRSRTAAVGQVSCGLMVNSNCRESTHANPPGLFVDRQRFSISPGERHCHVIVLGRSPVFRTFPGWHEVCDSLRTRISILREFMTWPTPPNHPAL
jgi:hypothetical protein